MQSDRVTRPGKGLGILQALEIAVPGREIGPQVGLAPEQCPFPGAHAQEALQHGAERIGVSVQAGVAAEEFVRRHALGLKHEGIRRIAPEPPVPRQQPIFA